MVLKIDLKNFWWSVVMDRHRIQLISKEFLKVLLHLSNKSDFKKPIFLPN